MIAPHTSCRYAVVYPPGYPDQTIKAAGGLRIVAVHGIDTTINPQRPMVLCSLVTIGSEHPTMYSPPSIIPATRILTFAQNLERAQVALRWEESNTR